MVRVVNMWVRNAGYRAYDTTESICGGCPHVCHKEDFRRATVMKTKHLKLQCTRNPTLISWVLCQMPLQRHVRTWGRGSDCGALFLATDAGIIPMPVVALEFSKLVAQSTAYYRCDLAVSPFI